jgi:hypothetical protein
MAEDLSTAEATAKADDLSIILGGLESESMKTFY